MAIPVQLVDEIPKFVNSVSPTSLENAFRQALDLIFDLSVGTDVFDIVCFALNVLQLEDLPCDPSQSYGLKLS